MGALGKYVQRWRTTLLVGVSTAMVVVLGFVGAPAADAAAAGATLSVSHSWQDGFIAHFSITNSSAVPLNDWKLEFDMPAGQSISHMWNGAFAQYGTHWVLGPANWNRIIAPGGSATGGFRGVLTGPYSPPLNCQLNRQYLCT
jgi:cellulase/cellobiase CelA1